MGFEIRWYLKTTLKTSGEDAKLHSRRVEKMQNYTRDQWRRCKITLETSGDAKLHSKRVEKMQNYTRDEWRRCKITLETSGEDAKLHSRRVEKSVGPSIFIGLPSFKDGRSFASVTINSPETTLETSGEDVKLHSKRVEKL